MKTKYRAQGDSFFIENYNHAAPFSSFFPAVAGETGKPMWVFYTNRGQGISSFGVNDKDGSMLEFLPANKAYQATSTLGFRTFISSSGNRGEFYEPFSSSHGPLQSFVVRPYELEIIESNPKMGLEISVVYFGVPGENCPVLARSVRVRNTTAKGVTLQIVDGLPRVVPYGMTDYHVKHMSRTIEAFSEVLNLKDHVPFFKLKVNPRDVSQMEKIYAGFFSFAVRGGSLVPVIVDPSKVFAQDTSFFSPHELFGKNGIPLQRQMTSNIMPSSLFSFRTQLRPGEEKTWQSYYGYANTLQQAKDYSARVKGTKNYFDSKRSEMKKIYQNITGQFDLKTGKPALDFYAQSTFMDNVLRGGYPLSFGPNNTLVHVFCRKHGDMERDYNQFLVSAMYYSQGDGNFRDVNQNRRHDLLLNPKVGSFNIDYFFNLIQLDGYNPLVILPTRFVMPRDTLSHPHLKVTEACREEFEKIKREPILLGEIYEFLTKYASDPLGVHTTFQDIISKAIPQPGAAHSEGFWVDHWTYNLDHLDQYFAVYPEKKRWLLYEKEDFTFYDSDHFVRPRREKYVVTPEGQLRQFDAVVLRPEKKELLSSRRSDATKVRTEHGTGESLKVSLMVKLLSLAAIKATSLDPFGVGIEMEADKPGWCDALNGLPGLVGSSSHEMFELHRLVKFILNEVLPLAPYKNIDIPQEIVHLIRDLDAALSINSGGDFRSVWDKLATARENFREKTFMGVSGKMRPIRMVELTNILNKVSHTLGQAEKKAIDPKTHLPTSYFTYEVDPSGLDHGWRNHLGKLQWKQHRLVPFLEGAVHAMKVGSGSMAKQIYKAVKRSPLADKKLGMYKLNSSLENESPEIGRIRIFSQGWLENESIFLHMHYKFLLELLRAGLIDEFLKESEKGLIPFRDPKVYGRSIYENSSFIASSAFPNRELHGKGFVARLSGATAEFLSMIYLMAFGHKFFKEVEGNVVFSPDPSLPREWFTHTDSVSMGKNSLGLRLCGVPVTFVNPLRRNTFGKGAAKPVGYEWIFEGRYHQHQGAFLTPEASLALREGKLESLTIFLGQASTS